MRKCGRHSWRFALRFGIGAQPHVKQGLLLPSVVQPRQRLTRDNKRSSSHLTDLRRRRRVTRPSSTLNLCPAMSRLFPSPLGAPSASVFIPRSAVRLFQIGIQPTQTRGANNPSRVNITSTLTTCFALHLPDYPGPLLSPAPCALVAPNRPCHRPTTCRRAIPLQIGHSTPVTPHPHPVCVKLLDSFV